MKKFKINDGSSSIRFGKYGRLHGGQVYDLDNCPIPKDILMASSKNFIWVEEEKVKPVKKEDKKPVDKPVEAKAADAVTESNKPEVKDEKYFKDLTKAEQVAEMTKKGLSEEDINALKYEDDRVKKLMELQKDE